MIINTKDFKNVCSKILTALDTSSPNQDITDILELKTLNNILYLNVTNKEYYVSVKFNLDSSDNLNATINAELFLKLISQITTETIELTTNENTLNIRGNGKYKLPLIFEQDQLLVLPKINIFNITSTGSILRDNLNNIFNYNSREIIKENVTKPIQKMYYLDNQGCITFTGTGACVNSFNLDFPIKILLNSKIVKLFKLFKYENININIGYDNLDQSDIIQTKIKMYDDEVELSAILSCDDTLLNSIPVNTIRSLLNSNYPYSVIVDKNILSQALNRLLLFGKNAAEIYNYYNFTFIQNEIIISDKSNNNTESLKYQNENQMDINYETILNINELKLILDGCSDQYINILFGNKKNIIAVRKNIKNILMEYTD